MTIDERMLAENVEYFACSMFMDPPRLMSEFQKAVEAAKAADGLIIDLRGNPGGLGAMAMGMGGWLVEEENIKLGTMMMRNGELNFVLNPRLDPYLGPVAILIDGLSGSTSEIFAGGMQAIGRARVFGETTAGQALPALASKLPNGDVLMHAIADYLVVDGSRIEGRGIVPDEVVPLTVEALAEGRDPALQAAVRWIGY
jgi:carboxyl-terminal processing protease